MKIKYLHDHIEFKNLLLIVSEKLSISPILVEKDYWIMHSLYVLKRNGFSFFLKGGTSLSKGFKIIDRFSEDIDILIQPNTDFKVFTGKNQNKQTHLESRRKYYDWLSDNISITGILEIKRDTNFDDSKYRSGGIRLIYSSHFEGTTDIKDGVLLEVGFDKTHPNIPITISSWAYDYAYKKTRVTDNRAKNISCYHPGYTFVEKLQAISTKYRKQQQTNKFSENFLRHYYDIYQLLKKPTVLKFLNTSEYIEFKKERFRLGDEINIKKNKAFLMNTPEIFSLYEEQYEKSKNLYYNEKPTFNSIISKIHDHIDIL